LSNFHAGVIVIVQVVFQFAEVGFDGDSDTIPWPIYLCPSSLEARVFLERIALKQLGRSLLIWAPLTNGAEKPEMAREVLRLAAAAADPLLRTAIIDLALVFAEWRGFGDVWRHEMEGFDVWQSQFLREQRNLGRNLGEPPRPEKPRF
jgi:hypothetical protein